MSLIEALFKGVSTRFGLLAIEKYFDKTRLGSIKSSFGSINFKNSLVFTFDKRQKGYVARWCEQNGVAKEHGYSIRCAINGWGCRAEVSRGTRRKIVADWPCRARIMSRLSRATVMPAKAKAEAELTRAVRRHRQISTSQAKSESFLPWPIAHFKGRFGQTVVISSSLNRLLQASRQLMLELLLRGRGQDGER